MEKKKKNSAKLFLHSVLKVVWPGKTISLVFAQLKEIVQLTVKLLKKTFCKIDSTKHTPSYNLKMGFVQISIIFLK